jgi:hypothetical protein
LGDGHHGRVPITRPTSGNVGRDSLQDKPFKPILCRIRVGVDGRHLALPVLRDGRLRVASAAKSFSAGCPLHGRFPFVPTSIGFRPAARHRPAGY